MEIGNINYLISEKQHFTHFFNIFRYEAPKNQIVIIS